MTASHIGIILHDFSTGGSERIAIRLGNAWAAQGRKVTLFCGTEDGALRTLVARDVAVVETQPTTRRTLISRVLMAFRVAQALREHSPEIVFAPGNYHMPVLVLLARMRFARRPLFICKLSNPLRGQGARLWTVRLGEMLMRIAVRPIDAFTAMSVALREQALAILPHHMIYHLDEPILADKYAVRQSAAVSPSSTIVCAGRLAPQKDFALALSAFARVDAALGARLLIFGEGPLRASLEAQAARLGISDCVEFAGYVPDIGPALAGARLFLMTSLFEGYPAVLIEALAAGVPVVTTDCSPAIHEIISTKDKGTVCASRNPDEIANAIVHALISDRSDAAIVAAGTQRHRMDIVSRTWLGMFDALLARAS